MDIKARVSACVALREHNKRLSISDKHVMDKLGLTRTTYYKLVNEFDTKTGRFEN